jgi:hypothetical protein
MFADTSSNNALDSFAIDPVTGRLTGPVSSVAVLNRIPLDLRVAPDESTVYGSDGEQLFLSRIGAGCSFTTKLAGFLRGRSSDLIAVETTTTVVEASTTDEAIDTYSIAADGTSTWVSTVSNQSQRYPRGLDGVDVLTIAAPQGGVHNVYAGSIACPGSCNPTQVQGFQARLRSMTPLVGSPAVDTGYSFGLWGGPVLLSDATHGLVLQASPYNNVVGWYNATAGSPGFPGSLTLGGNAVLASGLAGNVPMLMVRLGSSLYVGELNKGEIDRCSIGASGISACAWVITLTGAGSGLGGPIAVL